MLITQRKLQRYTRSSDLILGKQAELARCEAQVNEERKQREKDLQTRKEMVKLKLEVNHNTDKRVRASYTPDSMIIGCKAG